MALLYAGLTLFFIVHLLPAVAPGPVAALRQRIGADPVKGVVAVAALLGVVLIVLGWRSAVPQGIYGPAAALRVPALLLMAVSVWLLVLANRPSAVKRVLRHPQLTGVLLWCIAHLMLNGDSRSVALFGAFAVWSVAEMLLINRRDGAYVPAAAPPMRTDLTTAAIAAVGFVVLALAHPWLAGVPVLPAA